MLTNVCKPDKHGLCIVTGCTVTGPCVMYRDGVLLPRYPVPAIRTRVEYAPDGTVITVWPVNDPDGFVRYVYVYAVHGPWEYGSYDDGIND